MRDEIPVADSRAELLPLLAARHDIRNVLARATEVDPGYVLIDATMLDEGSGGQVQVGRVLRRFTSADEIAEHFKSARPVWRALCANAREE